MITGIVNAQLEIRIRLPVRNAAGQEQEVETCLDTGYSGLLTLTPSQSAALGLPFRFQSSVVLGNGSMAWVNVYDAVIVWDGNPRPIIVEAVDVPPLLGTRLLAGHDLRVRMVDGGRAEIELVP